MAERIVIALCVGLAQASIVWAVSTALHTRQVWPGTIVGFALGTASTLIFLRGR